VTEHEDRLLCADCLRTLRPAGGSRRLRWASVRAVLQTLAGVGLAWFVFYAAGRILLAIPESFHEGTVWQGTWMDAE